VDQLLLHFPLHLRHILFVVLGVQVELVVVLGDAELATDALAAEFTHTDDLLE
jgi:hypothetical protein